MRRIVDDWTPPAIRRATRRLRGALRRRVTRPPERRGSAELPDAELGSSGRLHLGSGPHVIAGWSNLDIEPHPGVLRLDLRQPLPLPDTSIDVIFSEHFIEHLSRFDGSRLLRECARVLRRGGKLRLSTPDLEYGVRCYREGAVEEWLDLGWAPETPCRMLNDIFYEWEHRFVYDWDELRGACEEAGFSRIARVAWRQSENPALRNLESRAHHHDLIVEATR